MMLLGLRQLGFPARSSPAALKIGELFYGQTTVFPVVGTSGFFTPLRTLFGTSHGPLRATSWQSRVEITKSVCGKKQLKGSGCVLVM